MPGAPAARVPTAVDAAANDYAQRLLELSPTLATSLGIRAVFDLMPTATITDWENIAGRMANVPAALDGYIASLREGRARGLVAAARQVRTVIEQTTAYAAADGF